MLALIAVVAASAAPAAQTGTKVTTVRVQLMEWMVMPSKARVPAGKVTFMAMNMGKLQHDFVVLRTPATSGMLPMAGAKAKEVGLVGRTPVLRPKQTRTLTLTLRPGRYLLICNVSGHYMQGMRAAFRVT
jgi:uncharacterized cupredoxin-like copper-binding protein